MIYIIIRRIFMKKSYKILMRIIPVFMVAIMFISSVYGISPNTPPSGNSVNEITGLAANIWSTVAVIIQILAIAAIILAGLRYMFASADQKADIKQQTIILVVGAVLVFAAVPIAQFIANASNSALNAGK
jgi:type IV secretory pathway VirB2 component (pilin)